MEWLLLGFVVGLALLFLLYGAGRQRPWRLALVLALAAISATSILAPRRPEAGSLEDPSAQGRPAKAEELGYVSSETCRSCHPREYATWHRSFHRTMTQEVGLDTVISDWDTTLTIRGREYRLYRVGEEFWVDMEDPQFGEWGRDTYGDFLRSENETERVQKRAVLATGSHHQQVYWFSAGQGRTLFLFPFTWLVVEKRWIPYEDSFLRPHYKLETTEVWNEDCVRCHSTGSQPNFLDAGLTTDTRVGEFGITCEACHGPAEEHIAVNKDPWRRYLLNLTDQGDSTIVHPKRLSAELVNDICGQCHSVTGQEPELEQEWRLTGFRYRPGDHLQETRQVVRRPDRVVNPILRFVADQFTWDDGMIRVSGRDYNGILDSECARGGELSCLSCHSMHQAKNDPRPIENWANDQLSFGAESDGACLQCHKSFAETIEAHTHHPKQSHGARCYNCHMPHTTYGLLKAIRSHTIGRSPSVLESVQYGRPNACNLCHLDKSLAWTGRYLKQWYGRPSADLSTEEEENRSAALLWLLQGNSVQRALVAWHMGWKPAVEASGNNWMAPFLAEALVDSYSGVRFIAGRSLQGIAGFEDIAYDYIAPETTLIRAKREVQARWRRMHPLETFQARSEIFFDFQGEVDVEAVRDVLRQRSRRQIHISE